jgi:hypothetical protein
MSESAPLSGHPPAPSWYPGWDMGTPVRHETPGGLGGHPVVCQRVNAEMLVWLGWTPAILWQFAHPLVAAGVANHHAFRPALLAQMRRLQQSGAARPGMAPRAKEGAVLPSGGLPPGRAWGNLGAVGGRGRPAPRAPDRRVWGATTP